MGGSLSSWPFSHSLANFNAKYMALTALPIEIFFHLVYFSSKHCSYTVLCYTFLQRSNHFIKVNKSENINANVIRCHADYTNL